MEKNKYKMLTHLDIGQQQELFFFDENSPGCCYFLPNGTIIYNTLQSYMRRQYQLRGFDEVKTPIMAKQSLWETSGHWQKYKENMFVFNKNECEYALAAMNCPKHCMIFKHSAKSYRDLPLRLADSGVLCRNELSGSVTSLTRNYTFCQDDAHIFCTFAQMQQEIDNAIAFLTDVYKEFGFSFQVGLSTRPDVYMGNEKQWDEAESILANVLEFKNIKYQINAKDGAFYGPKIDIQLLDSRQRYHQCATIQLDFQLPQNFQLSFVNNQGVDETPVMIHRAIYGSFERFIAILCEHYQGKWPFWLSPFQIKILVMHPDYLQYANKLKQQLVDEGLHVKLDNDDLTINKKIRIAQKQQYNYMLIVGKNEVKDGTVAVRYRDSAMNQKVMTVDALLQELKYL